MIVVGIDPHKKSHTAVAVDQAGGQVLGRLTLAATDRGHGRPVRWARGLGERARVALEDVRRVSGRLERLLVEQRMAVVRVPPRLMGQARRAGRERGTSGPTDATAVARAAMAHPERVAARLEGPELELHLLPGHRDDPVAERTRIQGRLRWHLHALDPATDVPPRALDRAVRLDRVAERLGRMDGMRARICAEQVDDCRRLSRRIDAPEREIARMAEAQAPEPVAIRGRGPLTAAKIVAEVAEVERFADAATPARRGGVAPVPVSSGARRRHRVDRAGNRQPDCALHRIAISRARPHPPAREHLERRIAEGKSLRQTRRRLKPHLGDVIFRAMPADAPSTSMAEQPLPAAAVT